MRTIFLLITVLVTSLSLIATEQPVQGTFGHNSFCSQDYDCLPTLKCLNWVKINNFTHGFCLCPVNSQWSDTYNKCLSFYNTTCSSDTDCQDVDDLRICSTLSHRCTCQQFSYENTTKWCQSAYNQTCTLSIFCASLNCSKGYCRCPVGYQYSSIANTCYPFGQAACQSSSDCQDADPNRLCDWFKQCVCSPSYYQDPITKLCLPVKTYNGSCRSDAECGGKLVCHKNLISGQSQCKCPVGNQWSSYYNSCISFNNIYCTDDSQCQDADPLMICSKSGYQCQCPDGFRFNSTGYCVKKSSRNGDCIWKTDCRDNMTCLNDKCVCDYKYQYDYNQQKCVLFTDGTCSYDDTCQDADPMMKCSFGKCKCKPGYQTINLKCTKQLFTNCLTNFDCPITDSVCNTDFLKNKCTCKQTYQANSDFSSCQIMSCIYNCDSIYFPGNQNMQCSMGFCSCKNGISSNTGKCYDASSFDDSGLFWIFFFIPIIIIISVVSLVIRVYRLATLARELDRPRSRQPSVAIVSTPDLSPDFVVGDRPPAYTEQDLPPSYEDVVREKEEDASDNIETQAR